MIVYDRIVLFHVARVLLYNKKQSVHKYFVLKSRKYFVATCDCRKRLGDHFRLYDLDIFPVCPCQPHICIIVNLFVAWCYCSPNTLYAGPLLAWHLSCLKEARWCRLHTMNLLTLALQSATRAPMGIHMMVDAARTLPAQWAPAG